MKQSQTCPRNHAVLFDLDEQRWRLSPAFDVVPDTEDDPQALVMQVSAGRRDITRDAMLRDHTRFGFATRQQAEDYMDALLTRIAEAFAQVAPLLNGAVGARMAERLRTILGRLAQVQA